VIDAFTAALIGRLTSLPWTVSVRCSSASPRPIPHLLVECRPGNAVTFALVLFTLAILFRPGTRLVQRISAGRDYVPVHDQPDDQRVRASDW